MIWDETLKKKVKHNKAKNGYTENSESEIIAWKGVKLFTNKELMLEEGVFNHLDYSLNVDAIFKQKVQKFIFKAMMHIQFCCALQIGPLHEHVSLYKTVLSCGENLKT